MGRPGILWSRLPGQGWVVVGVIFCVAGAAWALVSLGPLVEGSASHPFVFLLGLSSLAFGVGVSGWGFGTAAGHMADADLRWRRRAHGFGVVVGVGLALLAACFAWFTAPAGFALFLPLALLGVMVMTHHAGRFRRGSEAPPPPKESWKLV